MLHQKNGVSRTVVISRKESADRHASLRQRRGIAIVNHAKILQQCLGSGHGNSAHRSIANEKITNAGMSTSKLTGFHPPTFGRSTIVCLARSGQTIKLKRAGCGSQRSIGPRKEKATIAHLTTTIGVQCVDSGTNTHVIWANMFGP